MNENILLAMIAELNKQLGRQKHSERLSLKLDVLTSQEN